MNASTDAPDTADGPATTAGPHAPKMLSVPYLRAAQASSASYAASFKRRTDSLLTDTVQNLVVRLATATDPLVLWAIHLELDARNVPPCIRWPANEGDGGQLEFITFLADLLWICKRNPEHIAGFKSARSVFRQVPDSHDWHVAAHRLYEYAYWIGHGAVSNIGARALALVDRQRQDLMTLQTKPMRADRYQLQPREFEVTRERLLSHALEKPDRSGKVTPKDSAERRAKLWRVFVLSGSNQTATVKHWQALTGETMTRQAVSKQLEIIKAVLRSKG